MVCSLPHSRACPPPTRSAGTPSRRGLLGQALLLQICLLVAGSVLADDASRYELRMQVWCAGELRGEPTLVLAPGRPEAAIAEGGGNRWRLRVEVEETTPAELTDPDSVWLKVSIEQEVDGEWSFITDTMLGTRLGEIGRITVLGAEDNEDSVPNAPLYVELTASRLQ